MKGRKRHYFIISAAFLGMLIGALIAFFDWLINLLVWGSILIGAPQWALPLFPVFAIVLSVSALVFFKVKTESMADEVIQEYHEGHTPRSFGELIGKYLASVFTISLGASAGLEGASKWIGASATGLIQRKVNEHPLLKRFYHKIEIALLVGGSAGIAAILRAPISGAFMGVETPWRGKLAKEAMVPSLVASFVSVYVYNQIRGGGKFFKFNEIQFSAIHFKGFLIATVGSLLLGAAIGLFSRFFLNFMKELKFLRTQFENRFLLALIGGATLCFCGYLSYFGLGAPMSLQSGFPVIQHLLLKDFSLYTIGLLIVLRMVATAVTFTTGGVGGQFVPTATLGALLGAALEMILPSTGLPHGSFALLGVAAIANATYNIFFFGVVFIAELTLSPTLTFFAVLTCVPAYLICKGVSNSKYQRDREA